MAIKAKVKVKESQYSVFHVGAAICIDFIAVV